MWYDSSFMNMYHTMYCILYTVYCILYTVYCIMCIVYCIINIWVRQHTGELEELKEQVQKATMQLFEFTEDRGTVEATLLHQISR